MIRLTSVIYLTPGINLVIVLISTWLQVYTSYEVLIAVMNLGVLRNELLIFKHLWPILPYNKGSNY